MFMILMFFLYVNRSEKWDSGRLFLHSKRWIIRSFEVFRLSCLHTQVSISKFSSSIEIHSSMKFVHYMMVVLNYLLIYLANLALYHFSKKSFERMVNQLLSFHHLKWFKVSSSNTLFSPTIYFHTIYFFSWSFLQETIHSLNSWIWSWI